MTEKRLNSAIVRFAVVMSSSFLMINGVNLSLLFFIPLLVITVGVRPRALLRFNSDLRLWVLLFLLGATLSTLSNLWLGNEQLFFSSVSVFPNYVYWGLILLLFTGLASFLALDYERLFGAVTLGAILAGVYYIALQPSIGDDRFFKYFTPNNFSFLLICFTPHMVYWVKRRSMLLSLLLFSGILAQQMYEGRRAGVVLILVGGLLAYSVEHLRLKNLRYIVRAGILGAGVLLLLQTETVRTSIEQRSERVAQLVYGGTGSLKEDRSYLTRLAMREKGLSLFMDHKLVGVGLNNFTKIERRIEGNFEGAEYVVNKKIFYNVSTHNSYITILAEGGLAVFVPFVLLLATLLLRGARRFLRMNGHERVIFVSFCGMAIHFYFINAIVNSMAWFNIALLMYVVTRLRLLARVRTRAPVAEPPPLVPGPALVGEAPRGPGAGTGPTLAW